MPRALALILAVFLSGCATVPEFQPPGITLERVDLLELGFDRQRFELALHLHNPNPVPMPITAMRYDLSLDGRPLGSGSSSETVHLPARGDGRMQLELELDSVRLLGQLSDWLRRPPGEISYRLDGEVELGPLPRPLHFSRDGRVPVAIDPGAFGP